MKTKDEHGRLVENDERKFRPLDGQDITQEKREKLQTAINNKDWNTFGKTIYHILTGEEIP